MLKDDIKKEYYEWLIEPIVNNVDSEDISYRKLLACLHETTFTYTIPRDENRAHDGIDLRRRFVLSENYDEDYTDYLRGPCSVLEMMIALAIRCEENIMDDTSYGDRTAQWFWGMINSLGLGDQTDRRIDYIYVDDVIKRFLDRDYEPNGKGGLFTIRNCRQDLREVEIWYQLCWYLDNFTG